MSGIESAAVSHCGLVRTENQDHWAVLGPEHGPWDTVLIVADGMGGHQSGEEASHAAVQALADTLARELRASPGPSREVRAALDRALRAAHEAVRRMGAELQDTSAPGTTLTCALLRDGSCTVGHIGDTRAYLVASGWIKQLTEDDTWVADQVRRGTMSQQEAAQSPFRSQLLQALGVRHEIQPTFSVHEVRPGDRLVLCTDGVSEYVGIDEIAQLVSRAEDSQAAAEQLIGLALQRGGEDNATVVVARVPEERGQEGQREWLPPRAAAKDTVELPIVLLPRRTPWLAVSAITVIIALGGLLAALTLPRALKGRLRAPAPPSPPVAAVEEPERSVSPKEPEPPAEVTITVTLGERQFSLEADDPSAVLDYEAHGGFGQRVSRQPHGLRYTFGDGKAFPELRDGRAKLVLEEEGGGAQQWRATGPSVTWRMSREKRYVLRFEGTKPAALFTLWWTTPEAEGADLPPGEP